jgi:hypothetical protein
VSNRIETFDGREDYGAGKPWAWWPALLAVVYTVRGGDEDSEVIRLISARKADQSARQALLFRVGKNSATARRLDAAAAVSDKMRSAERPTAGHAGSEACGEVVRPGEFAAAVQPA